MRNTLLLERKRVSVSFSVESGENVVSRCPIGSRVTKENWEPVLADWLPERKVDGGPCRSFCKRSLDLKIMRQIAEQSPRGNSTKKHAGDAFEDKSEVTSPLNCKPPASNRTLKTLEQVTTERIAAKR